MAICLIIVHFSTWRARSMYDVACEFARAVVRSKDAQKQLARTSLSHFSVVHSDLRYYYYHHHHRHHHYYYYYYIIIIVILISKEREESCKHDTQRCIFNEIQDVWIADETLSQVFDIFSTKE